MTKSKSKVLATILLAIVIMTNILPAGVSLAANIGDSIGLTSIGTVPYHLRSSSLGGNYIITHLAGYYENGNFYPAYCLNVDKPGVEETEGYDVTLTEILSDQETYNRVWRTVVAGYPYNSPESLGVSDWRYAYQATKMAVYCALGQSDVNSFYATDSTGQQIVDLIHRLVNEGQNGTSTYRTPVANIDKSGNMVLEGDYYIQNYTVSSNVDINGYNVAIANFPEGTLLTNTAGGGQNSFGTGETFQVRIPKNTVETQDINGVIRVDVNSKSYAVFYATSYNPSLQDYAITGDPISLTSATSNLTLKANTASIKIHKVDSETNEAIEDTVYELTKEDGTVIGRGTTDSEGNLTFYELYQGNYVLKEVKSNDDYIISQESIDIRATYNKVTEVELENEHKKGNLKVYKVDKDNNKVALGNVEFDLYSEEFQKVIGTYTTDVNGEIYVENLRTGDYKWIEKTTNKWYNLAGDTEIKVEWDKTKESVIENELKKGQIRVIKVDQDNNEIKLKGVKFNVLDENNNVLETIITNDEGEAVTSRYAVRDFEKLTLQEVETLENYKLTEEPQTIKLEANEIVDVVFQNEKKKGQVKVIKIDEDNNEIRLEGIKFNVYDESGNIVDTLTTDKNGEAVSKRLPIDQEYTVQETKTLENYVLTEEPQTVILEEDQITDLTFTNEKKKGQIKVIKIDEENNEVRLEGVEFKIYDESGNEVGTLVTDKNGEAVSERLPIDQTYTVQETKTLENYVLTEEPQTVILEEDQITDLTFTNEKKKGQIKVIKIDEENNEVRLEGVEFKIYDESGNEVGTLVTDKNGEAVSERLPIDQTYTVQETKTLENYVLTEETQTVVLEQDQITDLTFENEKIKGKIEITKISADDNELTGEKKGTKLDGAVFEIYNEKDELVDTITIKDGIGTSKLLEYGDYYIKEVNSGSDNYLLNTEKFDIEIREHMKTIPITIENTSVDIGLDIDKNGVEQAQPNDEIKYSFNSLKNTSNVPLDNFTWTDNLPYEYVRITKLFTGTYNEDLDYVVKYKTNKSEDYIEYGTYNTQKNNYIDFTSVELEDDEYITDFKVEFGTVMPGFEAVEKPFIFAKVLPTVEPDDRWVNYTSLTGNYKEHELEDKAEWPTISYGKKLEIKKLPRTGF